jgi:hypothetical protein
MHDHRTGDAIGRLGERRTPSGFDTLLMRLRGAAASECCGRMDKKQARRRDTAAGERDRGEMEKAGEGGRHEDAATGRWRKRREIG